MLHRFALSICLVVPLAAFGQGVVRPTPRAEELLMTRTFASTLVATYYTSTILGDRPMQITAITTRCGVAAAGAGSVVFRVSDSLANACDCTADCTTANTANFGSTGPKRIACSGYCTFPPGAQLDFRVVTAGCATTQPNLMNMDVRAKPL